MHATQTELMEVHDREPVGWVTIPLSPGEVDLLCRYSAMQRNQIASVFHDYLAMLGQDEALEGDRRKPFRA